MTRTTRWILFAAISLASARAYAYPQFIAKSYTNCGTCHYNPTGGGLLNAYGALTLEATYPLEDLREAIAKPVVTGYAEDSDEAAFQMDVGLDARLLLLRAPKQTNGSNSLLLVPMLVELGSTAARGPLIAYGTVTPRRRGSERTSVGPFSREHWIGLRSSDTLTWRAGRMVLPFGLRQADHTVYVREDFGFDKWDQSYALALDAASESWMLSGAIFGGDFLLVSDLRELGATASVTHNLPSRAAVGVSAMFGATPLWARSLASVHVRWRIIERLYTLAEVVAQKRWSRREAKDQTQSAGMLRLGWFVLPSIDVFIEMGTRIIQKARKATKARYTLGVQWQPLPWIEVGPTLQLEETRETGVVFNAFSQIHLIY